MKTSLSQAPQNVHAEQDFFFKCPECGTEDCLVEYQDCLVKWTVNGVVDGEIEYDPQPEFVSGENNEYRCGFCGTNCLSLMTNSLNG